MSEHDRVFPRFCDFHGRFRVTVPHASGLCNHGSNPVFLQVLDKVVHGVLTTCGDPASCHSHFNLDQVFNLFTFLPKINLRLHVFFDAFEVRDGTVEIRAIAREAGSRTKIAVSSTDPNVDPVGACVGLNGARVNAIVNELRGEKIDIINWDDNPAFLIENALSPAKVISVVADEDEKEAQVIVPDYQLSLAIGKEGQNARLAARLTTYKIDIKSETQARELGLFDDMDFGEEGFEGEYEKDVEPAEDEVPAEETSEAQAETEE